MDRRLKIGLRIELIGGTVSLAKAVDPLSGTPRNRSSISTPIGTGTLGGLMFKARPDKLKALL